MNRKVIVIGGGASGMMAAIHAARAGADVTILEHTDRLGKKLLSTGNGRCNLTNLYQDESCYRCSQPEFPGKVLGQYPVEETLDFFKELGILIKSKGGYLYPNSEQASAVLEVLQMELVYRKVSVVYNCKIREIRKGKKGLLVIMESGSCEADAVVLAAGSKAAPVTGSDGSGYELARKAGHRIITPLPALVQLRCLEKHYKQLAGIRTEAHLTLLVNGKKAAEETGELQITDYGISGIPTFQISRFASKALDQRQEVRVQIDFLPNQTMEETKRLMEDRIRTMGYKTAEEWMTGIFNKKLASILLKLSGIHLKEVISDVDKKRMNQLLQKIKAYETIITKANPFENAQVCCGGVDTREIDSKTLESKRMHGLYLAGELLDVDGICGGYNLQWAWSSGQVAGYHAATGDRKKGHL